jgi:serine/threonine protein kinase
MNSEREQQIDALFEAILAKPVAERRAYILRVSGSDGELKEELELRLTAYETAGQRTTRRSSASRSRATAETSLLGQRVGPYVVTEMLGYGGMAEVYKAKRDDGQFQMTVAIKVVKSSLPPDEVKRFWQERQILVNIDHPSIARMIDGNTLPDGRPYLVMEFVEGSNLGELLRQTGPLPLRDVVEITRQLCAGLHAAHEQKIIHRDIKPENIVIGYKDGSIRAKLIDFGIAALHDYEREATRKMTGGVIGTVQYMSPEQASGASRKELDRRTDIYSLGLVIYEMLTGRQTFSGDTMELIEKQKSALPLPPSKHLAAITKEVDAVVLKALAKDRTLRQPTAQALAEELQHAAADKKPGPPVPPPVPPPVKKSSARAAVIVVLVLSLLGLLVVVGAGSIWYLQKKETERRELIARIEREQEERRKAEEAKQQEENRRRQQEAERVKREQELAALKPQGTIERVWTDHNVYENGEKGMRIHAKFRVKNYQDVSCYVSAFFFYESGAKLMDFNNRYQTKDGQVSTWSNFTPGYKDTTYDDLQLFIPYLEFHLGAGEEKLKYYVQLQTRSGEAIASSEYVNFTYTR